MVPNGSSYANYPSFANNGAKTPPGGATDSAKYALGMVPADTFPAEWANWLFHGATAGITRLNQDTGSIKKEINSVLAAFNITNDASAFNQLLGAILKIFPKVTTCTTAAATGAKDIAVTGIDGTNLKTGDVFVVTMTYGNTYGDGATTYPTLSVNSGTAYPIYYQDGTKARMGAWNAGEIVKFIFMGDKFLMEANPMSRLLPVGTVYQNKTDPTDPAVLFGVGHWTKITEEFLVAAAAASFTDGTNIPKFNGAANGGGTVTLTVENLPSHYHNLTASTNADGITASHSHSHYYNVTHSHEVIDPGHGHNLSTAVGFIPNLYCAAGADYGVFGQTGTLGTDGSLTGITLKNADLQGYTQDANNTAVTVAINKNTSSTGSGTAFTVIPKYRAVYTWYRDA